MKRETLKRVFNNNVKLLHHIYIITKGLKGKRIITKYLTPERKTTLSTLFYTNSGQVNLDISVFD